MKIFPTMKTVLISACVTLTSCALLGAQSERIDLASRGLPTILFNNDSDDLKWPAYPEHHKGLWVPAGEQLPLAQIHSLDDYLASRIGRVEGVQ